MKVGFVAVGLFLLPIALATDGLAALGYVLWLGGCLYLNARHNKRRT